MVSSAAKRGHRAFTVVELMVIIVVIGILVAISVFSFGAWRERIAETEIRSDLDSAASGMEDARNFNNEYPIFNQGDEFDGSNDTRDIFKQSPNVTIIYRRGDTESYCLEAQSNVQAGISFFLDTASGNKVPEKGTCT